MALTGVETKQPPENIRTAIRDLLTSSPEFLSLDQHIRLALAQGLVKICTAAQDIGSEADTATGAVTTDQSLAVAQSAGSEFSGVAAQRVADTTQQILTAVSFPRFVTELINGVFKALVDTNQQQMQSYVELIRNVAASTEGFAEANVGLEGARRWLVERFPGAFTIEGESDGFDDPGQPLTSEERAERDAETRLRLRPGAAMPAEGVLRVALGLGQQDSLPGGDPENLVALARVSLARNRQQMLSTMVMLGMQRIIIESGRLHASMRFHIDTRSAAQQDLGSQFDLRNTATASGSFGYGPWGASASMTNTIGFVSTQKTQTTEEMNTDLDLNSSVELVFKTDYLPLDRLAGREQVDRIKVNTLNPEAEEKASAVEREAREKRIADSETKRWASIDKSILVSPSPPSPPKSGERESPEDVEKKRQEAAKEEAEKKKKSEKSSSRDAPPSATGGPPLQTSSGSWPGTNQQPVLGSSQPVTSAISPKTNTAGKAAPVKSSIASANATALAFKPESTPTAMDPLPTYRPDVIFVPSSDEAIDEMLMLAAIQPGELLYDLGCGDGRIVVTAAKLYGCRTVGFDVDPERVAEARRNIKINQVEHSARIEQQDIFTVDLSQADVVTLYLLPELNVRLIPQLERMKPGARIVSHDFDMAGIIPDRAVQVYLSRHHIYKTIFLWTTPLKKLASPVQHEWANSVRLYAPNRA
jgi:hypothetical protein